LKNLSQLPGEICQIGFLFGGLEVSTLEFYISNKVSVVLRGCWSLNNTLSNKYYNLAPIFLFLFPWPQSCSCLTFLLQSSEKVIPAPAPQLDWTWPQSQSVYSILLAAENGNQGLCLFREEGFSLLPGVLKQGSMWLDDLTTTHTAILEHEEQSALGESQCQRHQVGTGRELESLMTSLSCQLCWAWKLLYLWSFRKVK
jgi:hypothetical protein